MRSARGPCPSAGELSAYLAGSLPPDQHFVIQSHIELCGVCDAISVRLANFDEPGAPPIDPDWQEREPRLRAAVFPAPRPVWRRLLLHPALAYAVAAATLGWVILRPGPMHPPIEAAPAAWQTVKTLDLNLVRSGKPLPALASSDKVLVLAFFVPITADRTYTLSVDGKPSEPIESYDGRGNFHILCDRAQLGSGSHRLTIWNPTQLRSLSLTSDCHDSLPVPRPA